MVSYNAEPKHPVLQKVFISSYLSVSWIKCWTISLHFPLLSQSLTARFLWEIPLLPNPSCRILNLIVFSFCSSLLVESGSIDFDCLKMPDFISVWILVKGRGLLLLNVECFLNLSTEVLNDSAVCGSEMAEIRPCWFYKYYAFLPISFWEISM